MSLRGRAIAYLVVLHAIFAALAVYLFLDSAFWLIAVEVVFAVSLVVGLRLVARDVPASRARPPKACG